MNDLPGFRLPGPAPIPPGALDRVVAAGVRRRRHAVATGGGVLCASLVLLAAFTGGLGSTTSLQPVRPPALTATPSDQAATPSAAPRPDDPPQAPEPPPRATTSPAPSPDASPLADPSPDDPAVALSHQKMRWSHTRYSDLTYGTQTWGGCHPTDPGTLPTPLDSPAPPPPWCFEVSLVDDHPATPDEPVSIRLAICRTGDDNDTHTVTWPSWQWGDITVGKPALWTWSTGLTFDQQTYERQFRPGDCYTLTTTWNGTDDDGYRVPDGTYVVSAWLTGSAEDGPLDRYAIDDARITAG